MKYIFTLDNIGLSTIVCECECPSRKDLILHIINYGMGADQIILLKEGDNEINEVITKEEIRSTAFEVWRKAYEAILENVYENIPYPEDPSEFPCEKCVHYKPLTYKIGCLYSSDCKSRKRYIEECKKNGKFDEEDC